MKQRFSSLDVKAISHELSTHLVGLRVANIYDLSSRIFLIKCAKPGTRQQLLVESGFRCHLTAFSRTAAAVPSAFVTRLRKYLKSRRITSVTQIGTDRVIEVAFSDGQYRLFLEFFAAGNLVLTDKDLTVVALLRQVSEGDVDVDVKLGSQYPVKAKQNSQGRSPLTEESVRSAITKYDRRVVVTGEFSGKKAKRRNAGDDLRKALSSGFPEITIHLLDHVFKLTGFDITTKPSDVLENDGKFSQLMKALGRAEMTFNGLGDPECVKGYIVAKRKTQPLEVEKERVETPLPREQLLYEDFHPFHPSQFEEKPDVIILSYNGFNKTVDEFYSSIESQKLGSRLTEREENAKRKMEVARKEHEKRLGALQQVQGLHIRKAQAIEANTHRVEEAIVAVNGLIAQGMDWMDIAKLIENEQGRQNPVAQMIKLPLKLYENTVTLLLDEASFEADEEDDEENDVTDEEDHSDPDRAKDHDKKIPVADKRLTVDVDLALSPWANARQCYDQKKTAALKEQKTVQASTKALKNTERKIEADLKKGLKQEKAALRPARKQFWFEKFLYFVSSEGYLVLGGKDVQQNEMLYRRYLKKGDIYVHADLQGAASVVVKNALATPDAPIPPSTMSQAGALSVCTSSAWDSKAVMAAWWVNADQVSKTAPTGEYLTTGGFVIRGEKNFLSPSPLLLGFAIMFQISEESKANHDKHRLQRAESMTSQNVQDLESAVKNMELGDEHEELIETISEDGLSDVEEAETQPREETETEAANITQPVEEQELNDEQNNSDDHTHASDDDSDYISVTEQKISNPLQPNGIHLQTDVRDRDVVDEKHNPDGRDLKDDDHDEAVHEPKYHDENEDADDDMEQDNEYNDTNESNFNTNNSGPSKPNAPPPIKSKQTPIPRGKRTKAKKAAKRYADQDEEDRELAMAILGSAKGAQEKTAAASESQAARDAKLAADKARRRAQHEKAAAAERARMSSLEKGSEDVDEDVLEQERLELQQLDYLVGTPAPGDEILAALPVAAPWGALGRCKYKVKLQPGSVKKGKAVREIVTQWMELGKRGKGVVDEEGRDAERVWPREVEAIRMWRVEEVVGVVPVGKCKVVRSGGTGGGGAGEKGKVGGGGGNKGKTRGGIGAKKVR